MAIGKTKDFNTREFKKMLVDNGFEFDWQNRGTHMVYKRGNDMIIATKDPNKMMIRRYIKKYNLSFK